MNITSVLISHCLKVNCLGFFNKISIRIITMRHNKFILKKLDEGKHPITTYLHRDLGLKSFLFPQKERAITV